MTAVLMVLTVAVGIVGLGLLVVSRALRWQVFGMVLFVLAFMNVATRIPIGAP